MATDTQTLLLQAKNIRHLACELPEEPFYSVCDKLFSLQRHIDLLVKELEQMVHEQNTEKKICDI